MIINRDQSELLLNPYRPPYTAIVELLFSCFILMIPGCCMVYSVSSCAEYLLYHQFHYQEGYKDIELILSSFNYNILIVRFELSVAESSLCKGLMPRLFDHLREGVASATKIETLLTISRWHSKGQLESSSFCPFWVAAQMPVRSYTRNYYSTQAAAHTWSEKLPYPHFWDAYDAALSTSGQQLKVPAPECPVLQEASMLTRW